MERGSMPIVDTPCIGTGLQTQARCLSCHYALRGLMENRCPECGRAFDPGDPRTMNLGPRSRWARWLIGPLPTWVRRSMVVGSGMVVWGSALLPGGVSVELIGWLILIAVTAYSLTRRFLRGLIRWSLDLARLPTPQS